MLTPHSFDEGKLSPVEFSYAGCSKVASETAKENVTSKKRSRDVGVHNSESHPRKKNGYVSIERAITDNSSERLFRINEGDQKNNTAAHEPAESAPMMIDSINLFAPRNEHSTNFMKRSPSIVTGKSISPRNDDAIEPVARNELIVDQGRKTGYSSLTESSSLHSHGDESEMSDVLEAADTLQYLLRKNSRLPFTHPGDHAPTTDDTAFKAKELGAKNDEKHEIGNGYVSKSAVALINLVPSDSDTGRLSDYNNLLTRNIEFFFPSKVPHGTEASAERDSDVAENKIGLRCIHCAHIPQCITAATFFPRSIGSIASGLGTIGSRHFGLGKCPVAGPEKVKQMLQYKKTSGIQTRVNGRIGLDTYCKVIAKKYNIINDEFFGICFGGIAPQNGQNLKREVQKKEYDFISQQPTEVCFGEVDHNSVASVLANMKHAFQPSDTKYFWECKACKSVPFHFRAKGSVVFSAGEPEAETIENHLRNCKSDKSLAIPRNAKIEPFYGDEILPIKVKWDSDFTQVETRTSCIFTTRKHSEEVSIKSGVEDGMLAFPEDKEYTTDFAYYTVLHLKKCYLTKPGGNRGACPVGFPGLACAYCAGSTNERRFFYTSADHLRNSFSHIPSHLVECRATPDDVKNCLEEFKESRNSQKSRLKQGYHKIFMDRVWNRLHGPQNGGNDPSIKDVTPERHGASSQASNFLCLVTEEDKCSTSDLSFFTLMQVQPYSLFQTTTKEHTKEVAFPGLVCRHCVLNSNGRKFFTTSAGHLGELLVTIANHMTVCKDCPDDVKLQINKFSSTHRAQIQFHLFSGSHKRLMNRVWNQLSTKKTPKTPSNDQRKTNEYAKVDPSKPLVTAREEKLVTPFTFYTMQQVRPCNLEKSGNGSRSAFEYGFPGLECIHCKGRNSRKFFYRTPEILAGEYTIAVGLFSFLPFTLAHHQFSFSRKLRSCSKSPNGMYWVSTRSQENIIGEKTRSCISKVVS